MEVKLRYHWGKFVTDNDSPFNELKISPRERYMEKQRKCISEDLGEDDKGGMI